MISLSGEMPKPWVLNPFIQSYTELTAQKVDRKSLKEIANGRFISAYEDQKLIGIAFCTGDVEWENEVSLSVLVLPSYRKSGIESAMLRLLRGKQSAYSRTVG